MKPIPEKTYQLQIGRHPEPVIRFDEPPEPGDSFRFEVRQLRVMLVNGWNVWVDVLYPPTPGIRRPLALNGL